MHEEQWVGSKCNENDTSNNLVAALSYTNLIYPCEINIFKVGLS